MATIRFGELSSDGRSVDFSSEITREPPAPFRAFPGCDVAVLTVDSREGRSTSTWLRASRPGPKRAGRSLDCAVAMPLTAGLERKASPEGHLI